MGEVNLAMPPEKRLLFSRGCSPSAFTSFRRDESEFVACLARIALNAYAEFRRVLPVTIRLRSGGPNYGATSQLGTGVGDGGCVLGFDLDLQLRIAEEGIVFVHQPRGGHFAVGGVQLDTDAVPAILEGSAV